MLNSLKSIDNFINKNKFALIFFSSNNCSVCTVLLPKIEEMMKKYPEIKIKKVLIDEIKEASGKYSIFTVPTILFFIDGKEIIRNGRFISVLELEKKIKKYYKIIKLDLGY
ncbi:thioredoxin [Clostridium acetireducens DSM 10703]|uniref:Thioredoxin n=1 Tax=Clostridium acetireducens DSM 10703 TaxID=1121290 RepID=A0A1E8EXP6_9CLOT|nr:thioredoxin family protein [Clostridium acetireducens]OFI05555.1 thioredoxin [Clostridium acetireducens DSM 10703]